MNERIESNGIVVRVVRHLLIHALAGAAILSVFLAIIPWFYAYASEMSLGLARTTILMLELSFWLADWSYLIVPVAVVVDVGLVVGLARNTQKAGRLLSGYSYALLLLAIGTLTGCVYSVVVPFTYIEVICDPCRKGAVRIILADNNRIILDGREIDQSKLDSELDGYGRTISGFCFYRDREVDINREKKVLQILQHRNTPIEFYLDRDFLHRIISEEHRPRHD